MSEGQKQPICGYCEEPITTSRYASVGIRGEVHCDYHDGEDVYRTPAEARGIPEEKRNCRGYWFGYAGMIADLD